MDPKRLTDLRITELQAIVAEKPLILIPVGTIEWHSSHLPLGVDTLITESVCEDISRGTGVVVAPTLSCGISRNLQPEAGYFGTVDTVAESTLANLIAELLRGYAKMGFKKAILMSGHFENEHYAAIKAGIEQVTEVQGIFMMPPDFCEEYIEDLGDVSLTWPYASDHAAEWETSMMLHYYPELVDMDAAPEAVELPMEGIPSYIRKRYPRRATREYGQKLVDAILPNGIKKINELIAES
ncbi:MAG: creatinine amidohydrolase [Chloroflexota bacterium]|nr:creatinine amidohydrolase [Chloroflexota bacterium]